MGKVFSSQIRSISMVADFWLEYKFSKGPARCIMCVKYPNEVENLNIVVGLLCFRFWVM